MSTMIPGRQRLRSVPHGLCVAAATLAGPYFNKTRRLDRVEPSVTKRQR
jgi:hypothetical protein